MTDPFYMLMLMKNLGKNYIVWDKKSCIDFKKPGRGKLHAIFELSSQELADIKQQVEEKEKITLDRQIDILDGANNVIASVIKTLYVRKK